MEIAQLLSRATGEGDYSAYVASAAAAAAAKYLLDFERTEGATQTRAATLACEARPDPGTDEGARRTWIFLLYSDQL